MSDTLAAIEDYTRLTILRLRGELAVDDRPRLDALEEQLRDQIDGARPAPRKIENPSAAPSRPTMNVKPAQVTVTRRGPGEDVAAAAVSSIAPAPPASLRAAPSRPASVAPTPATSAPPPAAPPRAAPPAAAPRAEPPRVRSEPAPTLSTLDKSKLNEIPARAVGRTAYTPSVSPLFMDDYYESTLAPDHSLSGHDKATRVLALGEETMALPEEARVLFGVSDAPVIRAATPADPLRTADPEEGELTELRGDGEETEAREPVFAGRSLPRDNSQTAIAPPPPARPTPAPPRVSGTAPARPSAVAPPVAPPPSRPAPASPPATPSRPAAPTASAPPQAPRTRPPEARPITPIIVQLLSGETKRGELVTFEPDAGVVTLRATPQAAEESVDVNEVFAVFVGHARGVPPRPAEGTRIAVRMTNDREVVGVSPDYAPGANSMTLVPDDRRTVDRIWIPAWSVTEIRFA